MTPSLTSIVLPVRDQAGHIERVVNDYQLALSRLAAPHELLLVPNACRDGSVAICDAIARRSPSVRVVRSELGGWGRAVRIGLAAAKGDLAGYTNCARTSSHDLARLVAHAIANPGAVIAAERRGRGGLVRGAGSLLYNLECRALFGVRCRDVNGTPKVFPRSFWRLFELTRDDDLIDAEFYAVCREQRYPVVALPIWSHRRYGGASTTGLRSAIRMYTGALWLRLERR